MLQNDSYKSGSAKKNPIKYAEHAAPLLCLCVLALLVAAQLILPSFSGLISAPILVIAVSACAFLVPSGVFLIVFRKNNHISARLNKHSRGTTKFCFAALFLLISTAILTKSIICYISGVPSTQTDVIMPGAGYFEALFCYAILPAVLEELVFRGAAFSAYERSCGGLGAIVMTSVFFSAIHFSASEFISYFVSGLILGSVVYISRSVIPAMILHFINNLTSFYLENAVFKIASESKSGILAIFILTAFSLLMLFWFLSELENVCKKRYLSSPAEGGDLSDENAGQAPRMLPHGTSISTVASRSLLSPFFWCGMVLFAVCCAVI